MSRVAIVSKTRLKSGKVCVGAIDIDNRRSLRLLDAQGQHHADRIFEIGDLWEVTYHNRSGRSRPHVEDVRVIQKVKLRDAYLSCAEDIKALMADLELSIYDCTLEELYDGKLREVNDGKNLCVVMPDAPDYSTCFWISDRDFRATDYVYNGDVKQRVASGVLQIPYRGMTETPLYIPQGSLLRMSLANPWSPSGQPPLLCYLQLSGVFH